MRVLLMRWKCFCLPDFAEALNNKGYETDYYEFPADTENTRINTELAEKIIREICRQKYAFVFSFNYFPVISIACNACRIRYVSWTYDSPFIQLYSNTLSYPYNTAFIFDRAVVEELHSRGIRTVHYLPMAASVSWLDTFRPDAGIRESYHAEVAFVGSTYSEEKNRFYDKLAGVSGYVSGYLEGLIQAQKRVYGAFLLDKPLTPEVMEELMRVCPAVVNPDGFETLEWMYANYFLARRVTALERQEILALLSEKHLVHLYTNEATPGLPRVKNCGIAEMNTQMPLVYKCADINLNISLRSILTGMPLRALEIMGCGGFLLSNYQEDFLEFFTPDEDFVYYEDYGDLEEKVRFYLSHAKTRRQIARNGYEKVKQSHTFTNRVETILAIIREQG